MTAIKLEKVYYAYEADEGEKPVNAVDGVSLEVPYALPWVWSFRIRTTKWWLPWWRTI